MNKNTDRRTVTTTNIVTYSTGTESASVVWSEEDMIGLEYTLDLMIRAHQEDTLDADGYRRPADVFEFEFPGQRVIVFTYDGEVLTVITVEDEFIGRLHKAIRRQRPVTIGYTKQYDGEDTVRTVEPTSLRITKSGNVTLGGRDRRSGEYRSFRVDLMADITVHRSKFVVDDARAALIAEIRAVAAAKRETENRETIAAAPVAVGSARKPWTGVTDPATLAFSAAGWSVIVRLDGEWAAMTPTGTLRVDVAECKILATA